MVRTWSTQIFKPLPVLIQTLPIQLPNTINLLHDISFLLSWKVLLQEQFLHFIPRGYSAKWQVIQPLLSTLCQRKRECPQFDLLLRNTRWLHTRANHMELLQVLVRLLPCETMESGQDMDHTRLQFKSHLQLMVLYAQRLLVKVGCCQHLKGTVVVTILIGSRWSNELDEGVEGASCLVSDAELSQDMW